jgi:hypothetical protein
MLRLGHQENLSIFSFFHWTMTVFIITVNFASAKPSIILAPFLIWHSGCYRAPMPGCFTAVDISANPQTD